MIIHINNDVGAWGAGFVLALSKRWTQPEKSYRIWKQKYPCLFQLGQVQFVPVEPDIIVANMIAQHQFPTREKPQAVDYQALETCLKKVSNFEAKKFSIHAPRIGAGLGGGDWKTIESLLIKNLVIKDIPVTIYDLA